MKPSKLIIWDFDGVIADTEHLWVGIWRDLVNERLGLGWDFDQANAAMGGRANKTKIENFKKMGIDIDDAFMAEVKRRDRETIAGGLALTPGVEEIFRLAGFAQCVATGGDMEKTFLKTEALELGWRFSSDNVFVADQVAHGKPAPDLFEFAASSMGYAPEECIVVEDSLAGLSAGLAAGMETVAYLGAAMNRSAKYREKVLGLGIRKVFYEMDEVKEWIVKSVSD